MKVKHSLKISLHGMDSRMQSMMTSYLELNCKGIACVAKEFEAEAEIVDVDLADSKNILQERLAQKPDKPIIAISLYDISSTLAIYVKKPIKAHDLIKTINTVKKNLVDKKTTKFNANPSPSEREVSEIFQQKSTIETKKTVNNKLNSPSKVETTKNTPSQLSRQKDIKPVNNQQTKVTKPKKSNQPSIQKPSENSTQPSQEIDKFLKEFNQRLRIITPNKASISNISEKNRRNTVRYTFQQLRGQLKKNSLLGINKNIPILIKSISSKGALIKLKRTLKLNENVTLKIKLDSLHVFTIPAKVIRKNSKTTYGLAFVDYQHTLTEFLINSRDSFNMQV
ncbi:MAG: hypothetical protein V3U87_10385 [Methylococcaceae bacterium]